MAIILDATTKYATSPAITSGNNLTICGWANCDAYVSTNFTFDYYGQRGLAWRSGTVLSVAEYNNSWVNFASSPALDTWYYWAVTCDGTTIRGYWGTYGSTTVVSNSATGISSYAVSKAFQLGVNVDHLYTFNGSIAHVRIWEGILTQAELFGAGGNSGEKASATPIKAGCWSSATFATDGSDQSGNGNNWTVSGTPSYGDGPALGVTGAVSAVSTIATAAIPVPAQSTIYAGSIIPTITL